MSHGSPGSVLREVRVGRSLEIEDISAALGMRAEYIEAVEADQAENALGPNRSMKVTTEYAEMLGLDVQVIEDWFAGVAFDDDREEPPTLATHPKAFPRVPLLFDESRHARAVAVAFGRPVSKTDSGLRLRRFGVLLVLVGVLLSLISLYPQIL